MNRQRDSGLSDLRDIVAPGLDYALSFTLIKLYDGVDRVGDAVHLNEANDGLVLSLSYEDGKLRIPPIEAITDEDALAVFGYYLHEVGLSGFTPFFPDDIKYPVLSHLTVSETKLTVVVNKRRFMIPYGRAPRTVNALFTLYHARLDELMAKTDGSLPYAGWCRELNQTIHVLRNTGIDVHSYVDKCFGKFVTVIPASGPSYSEFGREFYNNAIELTDDLQYGQCYAGTLAAAGISYVERYVDTKTLGRSGRMNYRCEVAKDEDSLARDNQHATYIHYMLSQCGIDHGRFYVGIPSCGVLFEIAGSPEEGVK